MEEYRNECCMIQFNYYNDHGREKILTLKFNLPNTFITNLKKLLHGFKSLTRSGRQFSVLCGNCYSPIGLDLELDYSDGHLSGVLYRSSRLGDGIVGIMMLPFHFSEAWCIYLTVDGKVDGIGEYQCECGCNVIYEYKDGEQFHDEYDYVFAKNIIFG